MAGPLALGLFALIAIAGVAAALLGRHLVADQRKAPGWIALALAVLLLTVGAAGIFRLVSPPAAESARVAR